MAESSKTNNIRIWEEHLDRARKSGLSKKAYCRENGFSENRLYYWQRRLSEKSLGRSRRGRKPKFVEIKMDSVEAGCGIKLYLPNGFTLECGQLPDPAWLSTVLAEISGRGSGNASS